MTALWTEACLTFPTLDALRDGYEVYPVVDAVGGDLPCSPPSRHSARNFKPAQNRDQLGPAPSASCNGF